MRSSSLLLTTILASTAPVLASEALPDTLWTIQMHAEIRSLWGTPLDRDRALYTFMGLSATSSDGSVNEPVDPSYTGPSLGIELWRKLGPAWQIGMDMDATWFSTEHSGKVTTDSYAALSEQSAVAGVRWLPISFNQGRTRLGLQGGLGLSMGTLHRFALANAASSDWAQAVLAQGSSSATVQAVQDYISAGNQDLSLSGWLWQTQLRLQSEIGRLVLGTYMGLEGESSSAGRDPISGRYFYSTTTNQILLPPPGRNYDISEFNLGIDVGWRF